MIKNVVFDLGGVLIDWNPRHLYRKVFTDEEEMERFLADICTYKWNLVQDGGKLFSEATAELTAKFPEHTANIALYYGRWTEMMGGEIKETLAVFNDLKAAGMPLYALTNWSHEAFPWAYEKYDFMKQFDGIVVSGFEKVMKPDHRIYYLLMERYRINPAESVYIDDNRPNVDAAAALGFHGIHFTSAEQLRNELKGLGLSI